MLGSFGEIKVIRWSFGESGVPDKWSGMRPPPNICEENKLGDTWASIWYVGNDCIGRDESKFNKLLDWVDVCVVMLLVVILQEG